MLKNWRNKEKQVREKEDLYLCDVNIKLLYYEHMDMNMRQKVTWNCTERCRFSNHQLQYIIIINLFYWKAHLKVNFSFAAILI